MAEKYTGYSLIVMKLKHLQTYHTILRATKIHVKAIIKSKVMHDINIFNYDNCILTLKLGVIHNLMVICV